MAVGAVKYSPSKPLSIREASVVTGIPAKHINRLIDDNLLPKTAYKVIDSKRVILAYAAPMLRFGASDGAKLGKPLRLSVMKTLERFSRTKGEMERAMTDQVKLMHDEGPIRIDLSGTVKSVAEGLRRLEQAEKFVVRDPGVRAGLPTIRGTRIGVHEAAGVVKADGEDVALETFPSLEREVLRAAVIYAEAHPVTGRPKKSAAPLIRRKSVAKISLDD